jgi:hypothetical protein
MMKKNMSFIRRGLLLSALLAVYPQVWGAPTQVMEVWKGPSCGCCQDWINIIQKAGFKVITHDTGNTDARAKNGIPVELGSCHTALIGGYAIEGHVPVREIERLLAEKPDVVGLAVPSMPIGSPGMDGPAYGNRTQAYNVLLVKKNGSTSIYQKYI